MSKPELLDPTKEAKAVAAIREAFQIGEEDEALVLDTIEGETSLFEAVDVVLERIANAEVMLEGLEAVIAKLASRKVRYETRIKTDRALLEQALSIAELNTLERPAATLTLSARAPGLTITEESDIPAKYWKPGDPKLDKKALTADLRERAKALAALPEDAPQRAALVASLPEIPGATLSNGAPSLTIRRA